MSAADEQINDADEKYRRPNRSGAPVAASPIQAAGEPTLAQKMIAGWNTQSDIEYDLLERLERAGMPEDWCDFWWDNYDVSWEFGPVAADFVMPQSCLDILWQAGFARGWINFADDTEIHYTPKGASERHPGRHRERKDGLEAKRNRARIAPPKAALIDQALDDWMVTYADTESGEDEQYAACKRMADAGGTLAYIAKTRRLLARLSAPVPPPAADK